MRSSASKIQLSGFSDLFQTGGTVEADGERVQDVPLSELYPFKGHPFQVRDDEAMLETADSIAKYGVDLLSVIVAEHLQKVDFATFNVSEAIRVANQFTQNEIEECKQKPPSQLTEWYINEVLMHDFTHAALLVAECLADYYQTGELTVMDYVGENCDPVEHHITDFTVTGADLYSLLEELQKVQDPEHWLYQCWVSEETRQRWLKHIRSVYQTLSEHT